MLALAALGCAEDAETSRGSGTGAYDEPLYVLSTQIFTDDGERTVYFALMDSLDVDEVNLDDAREEVGVANRRAVGGRLLISSGESPEITEYRIDDAFNWEAGETLSFAAYPLADNANFFSQFSVDDHHMYLPFDGYKRIVWDPTDFEILEVAEDTSLPPDMDGLKLEPGGNRTGIAYDGAAMMPFFFHDDDWYEFAPTSLIAIYDPETHEEEEVIEAPCSGLAIASQDEGGNTYFSSWDYGPMLALFGMGPAPCTVRITPDFELDDAFTTDMRDWTGGRYVVNFRYVRDGWGLADVFHDERVDTDFSAGTIDTAFYEDEHWNPDNWSVWRVDLENETAEPYDAIDLDGGWGMLRVDDRTFLTITYDDYARTRIYELHEDGSATEHLDVEGEIVGWDRIR